MHVEGGRVLELAAGTDEERAKWMVTVTEFTAFDPATRTPLKQLPVGVGGAVLMRLPALLSSKAKRLDQELRRTRKESKEREQKRQKRNARADDDRGGGEAAAAGSQSQPSQPGHLPIERRTLGSQSSSGYWTGEEEGS